MAVSYLLALVILFMNWTPASADTYQILTAYLDGTCNGTTPYVAVATINGDCNEDDTCANTISISCASDYMQALQDIFSGGDYIIQKVYTEDDCTQMAYAIGLNAVNSCVGGNATESNTDGYHYNYTSYLYDNGSAAVDLFNVADLNSSSFSSSAGSDYTCSATNMVEVLADKHELGSHSCLKIPDDAKDFYQNGIISNDSKRFEVSHFRWYSSDDSSDSGLSIQVVVEIVSGCVVAPLLIGIAIFFYRRRTRLVYGKGLTTTALLEAGVSSLSGQVGLWNDDVITAKRIPRDKIRVNKLLTRGAYGQVYSGRYYRQQVAIKVLLPANRSNIKHVNDFLAEAKLMASMEHPHIISFVGVAWDSLCDLCIVLEFMDNGDLRTLLDKYVSSKHPVGIDRQKATIALHVCHALTYLHSLLPAVIHRDLKSRNILLNHDMQAKLTDFGISRERMDQTMTAGVGTSLWMAPEVMLGERYDVKADMFSFGVVLSELDTHSLPYAQAKKRILDTDGRQLTDAVLLQQITSGTLLVDFSPSSPESIMGLGRACVSIDPNDRPTAAEAAYRLQVILSEELQ